MRTGAARFQGMMWPLGLGVLLLAALALRWPPPGWTHFDEEAFIVVPLGFWGGDLNPHFFNYPTFHFYLCSLVYYLGYLFSGSASAGEFAAHRYFAEAGDLLHLARGVQVLFSLGAVAATALLGRRLYGVRGGLLAGLLLALMPLSVRFSCIANTDGPAAFWAVLALCWAMRICREGRPRDYLLAGVFAGLAGATKYPAALAVVPVATAALGRASARAGWWRAAGAAGLAFALATPFVWLDPAGFWRDFSQMGWDHLLASRAAGPAWLFHLGHSLRHGVGVGGLLAAGLALARRPWRPEERVLAAGLLAFSLPLLLGGSAFMRYALPLAPLLALLASRTLVALRRPLLLAAVAAAVAAEPLYASLRTRQLLAGPDTRALAGQWLAGHFPQGGRLISLPQLCGSLQVLTPRQVYVRQTHYLRSYGEPALRRAYEELASRPDLPPLYLELGGDLEALRGRLAPAGGDSLVQGVLAWARHPVCGGAPELEEGDPLLAAADWQANFSPGDLGEGTWDDRDWYFLPVAGFGQFSGSGPEIRLGLVPLRGTGDRAGAQALFAALAEALRGRQALGEERWEEAAGAYLRALDSPVPPEDLLGRAMARHLWAQLGRAHLGQQRFGEAAQALERAIWLGPAEPEVYNDLGIARAGSGQLGTAVQAWEEGLARHPDFAPAHFNLGRALAATGQLERARTHWRRGLELMPGHPQAGRLRRLLGEE
jgi:tetratricopeptide (TPR) repeat protein